MQRCDLLSKIVQAERNHTCLELLRRSQSSRKLYLCKVINNQAVFMPADPQQYPDRTIYYMSFTEILKILREISRNNSLKSYNLQTAMRKCGYETHSYKKERFSMQPRNLYAVQVISSDMYVINSIYQFQ